MEKEIALARAAGLPAARASKALLTPYERLEHMYVEVTLGLPKEESASITNEEDSQAWDDLVVSKNNPRTQGWMPDFGQQARDDLEEVDVGSRAASPRRPRGHLSDSYKGPPRPERFGQDWATPGAVRIITPPQCTYCVHLTDVGRCRAFPAGIPASILMGDFDHTEPYPGDHGIRYEPLKDKQRSPVLDRA